MYLMKGVPFHICTRFGGTYTKIGTIQRRLAWPLRKDDTQIREAFHIFPQLKLNNLYFMLIYTCFPIKYTISLVVDLYRSIN